MLLYLISGKRQRRELVDDTLRYLAKEGLSVTPLDVGYAEFRGSIELIVTEGVRECCRNLLDEVLLFKSGLFVDSLNDFPGTITGYALNRIGLAGLLKLMEDKEDRRARWEYCLGYGRPGTKPKLFKGVCVGTISFEARGDMGHSFDSVFVPEGHESTFGEGPSLKDDVGAAASAVRRFVRWYRPSLVDANVVA